MVNVGDLYLLWQSVDRDGDGFRDVSGVDLREGDTSLHKRRHPSSNLPSGAVMADAGVPWNLKVVGGPEPGFLDADDGRRFPHLRDAVPQLPRPGSEAVGVPLENPEINDGG